MRVHLFSLRFGSLLLFLTFAAPSTLLNSPAQFTQKKGDKISIACRVLESHSSAPPALTAVLFHQRDRGDQARLAIVLREDSGKLFEIERGGENHKVTVWRLKSCFGRGLLILPAEATPWNEGDTFVLRFPAAPAPVKLSP